MSTVRKESQCSQTDITFPDATAKYLPLEKVYIHILEKVHEALFDLRQWDCSFDKNSPSKKAAEDRPERDSIIRRADKRRPSVERTEDQEVVRIKKSPRIEERPESSGTQRSPLLEGIIGQLCGGAPPQQHTPLSFNSIVNSSPDPRTSLALDNLVPLRLALPPAVFSQAEHGGLSSLATSLLNQPAPPPLFSQQDLLLPSGLCSSSSPTTSKCTSSPDMGSPTGSEIKTEGSGGEKIHHCPYCEARFTQKSNLKTHVFGVHQFKLSTCRMCKIITSKEMLKEHMKTHPNRGFKCQQCDTSFDTQIRLLRHMKIHSTERPYKCTFCPKSFVYKWNLTEHIRIHTGEKPFVCRLCGKGFCQSSTLKRHSLAMHTTEKPYKCSQCDESFVRILMLKKHFVNKHMAQGSVPPTSAAAAAAGAAPPPQTSSPSSGSVPVPTLSSEAISMLHMLNNTVNNEPQKTPGTTASW